MPTWRHLLVTLRAARIDPTRCFFTNAYVGLKAVGGATGKFAGEDDPEFRSWCEAFLLEQVDVMRPAVVVALGGPARRFLAGLSAGLGPWSARSQGEVDAVNAGLIDNIEIGPVTVPAVSLVHPSYWAVNVGRRAYVDRCEARHVGAAAEKAMLTDAIALSGADGG